jgi:tetratricopeptide (TPR) repeat protein
VIIHRTRAALVATVLALGAPASVAANAETPAERCAHTAKDGDIGACSDAIAADAGDIASLKNLALAFLSLNDGPNCFRLHQDVIARMPGDADAHFGYAVALATFRQYREAAAPAREALRLNPDDLLTLRLAYLVLEMVQAHDESYAVLTRGAAIGDRLMMFDLAQHLRGGRGGSADPVSARLWLERAAEHGHVMAMRMIGEIYRDGRDGAPRDPELAARWAERARREGFAP